MLAQKEIPDGQKEEMSQVGVIEMSLMKHNFVLMF